MLERIRELAYYSTLGTGIGRLILAIIRAVEFQDGVEKSLLWAITFLLLAIAVRDRET